MQSTERWRDTARRVEVSEMETKIKRPVDDGRGGGGQRDLESERGE